MTKSKQLSNVQKIMSAYPKINVESFYNMLLLFAEEESLWDNHRDLVIEECILDNIKKSSSIDAKILDSDFATLKLNKDGFVNGKFWNEGQGIPVNLQVSSQYNEYGFGTHTIISYDIERYLILHGFLKLEDYLPDATYTFDGHQIQLHRAVVNEFRLGEDSKVIAYDVIIDVISENDLKLIIGGEHDRKIFRRFYSHYALLGLSLLKKFSSYNVKPRSLTVYV